MTPNEISYVASYLSASVAAMTDFAGDPAAQGVLLDMAGQVEQSLRAGNKLLIAGNGGSAADAQHIAAEFTSRLMYDRAPLAALALTTDSSALTAIGNDYGFELVFDRQLRGLGRAGDVFLAITTSGRSPNILRALKTARETGIRTLGFTGRRGGEGVMGELCDHLFCAPSEETAIIQQVHITAAHILCALVERAVHPRAAVA
ncbi:D-sedoheptulose 7-phosphate isomerase [Roseomonas sp. BN140053]|uniref:D-sedoheptulose 7-phosphate isomerase n=1 Tax=Roseomonas sp. BN140053 TaxID=3391898 RepID=UPI0039E8B38A